MRRAGSSLTWTMIATLLLGGCDEQQRVVNGNEMDGGDEAIAIAWEFIKARSWQDAMTDDWRNVEVNRVVVDDNYELVEDAFKGEEALAFTFEANPNSVAGVPTVLVAPETNEVIGYMPSE